MIKKEIFEKTKKKKPLKTPNFTLCPWYIKEFGRKSETAIWSIISWLTLSGRCNSTGPKGVPPLKNVVP